VDTGATKSALFGRVLRVASRSHGRWPSLHGVTAPTLVGVSQAAIVRVPRVEIAATDGWLAVNDMDAAVLGGRLEPMLSQTMKAPVAGLLGYTFLRRYRVVIDFRQQIM